jgi:D-amino-acid oxidase
MQQVQKRGARIVRQTIASLTALAGPRTIVVNCTGLGARNLCDDRAVVPIRGQLLRIAGPGPDQVLLDKHDDYTAYIIPRADDCILGATAQVGDDDLEPRSADTNFLLDICAALDPRLCGARILETVVGIRPGRPTIRLEHEALGSGRHVVHNYGHGGAGVTLSWGCATEVVSMVNTLTRR